MKVLSEDSSAEPIMQMIIQEASKEYLSPISKFFDALAEVSEPNKISQTEMAAFLLDKKPVKALEEWAEKNNNQMRAELRLADIKKGVKKIEGEIKEFAAQNPQGKAKKTSVKEQTIKEKIKAKIEEAEVAPKEAKIIDIKPLIKK